MSADQAGAVFDASALLAYLHSEPGAEIVADAIAEGAFISTVNLAEVLSHLAVAGVDPVQAAEKLKQEGLLDGALTADPFTTADAIEAARLRPLTRSAGLSLGDRACLALARRLGSSVLTADSAWADLSLDVELRAIR